MAMPQRDDTIEAIKRLDALLEYAVMHGDEEEAERIREELRKQTESVGNVAKLGMDAFSQMQRTAVRSGIWGTRKGKKPIPVGG